MSLFVSESLTLARGVSDLSAGYGDAVSPPGLIA